MKTQKNKQKTRFSVSFPADLLKALERRRSASKRSRNQEIVYLIEQAIKPATTEALDNR